MEGRTCGDKPMRGCRAPWAEKKCSPDRGVSAKVWRAPLSQVLYLRGILTLVLSSGQRDLAGLYSERLPIAPPPARLQSLVRRRRRTHGAPGAPPTEDVDGLSATNSEVETAMNHRRRRTILRDACFSQGALDAFNSGDAHLCAAQNGLARATEQYVKDIRVRKFW